MNDCKTSTDEGLNRRDFLRCTAGAAAVLATGSLATVSGTAGAAHAAEATTPPTKMTLQGGRSIDILLPGFPGGSPRGFLGWASILALHGKDGITIVDTGQAGDRPMLLKALKNLQIDPAKVAKVFVTHFHFDHVNNVDIFPNAVIVLSETEWNYAKTGQFEK